MLNGCNIVDLKIKQSKDKKQEYHNLKFKVFYDSLHQNGNIKKALEEFESVVIENIESMIRDVLVETQKKEK